MNNKTYLPDHYVNFVNTTTKWKTYFKKVQVLFVNIVSLFSFLSFF